MLGIFCNNYLENNYMHKKEILEILEKQNLKISDLEQIFRNQNSNVFKFYEVVNKSLTPDVIEFIEFVKTQMG